MSFLGDLSDRVGSALDTALDEARQLADKIVEGVESAVAWVGDLVSGGSAGGSAPPPSGGAPGGGLSPTHPPAGPVPCPPGGAEVKTGLGPNIDKHLKCSPTLKKNIETLQKDGWTISYGAKGKGSFCDRNKKQIIVDPSESELDTVQTLAHESGHALYTPDPYVPPDGLTRDEYIKRNANSSLKDEGEATMMNCTVRDEALANCNEDIGVAGSEPDKYKAIAKKYPDPADREKARQEIGDIFADNEHPSTDPSKTYRQYYEKSYADFWDKTHPTPPGP